MNLVHRLRRAALAPFALLAAACRGPDAAGHTQLERLPQAFLRSAEPDAASYADLLRYFVAGFEDHRLPDGSGARYAGMPSNAPGIVQSLEGFSRFAPLAAAWIHGGRAPVVRVVGEREVDLADLLRRGFRSGTDPASAGYWGDMVDYDQRIVEAADLALVLWLARDAVWTPMTADERLRVAAWLRQVNDRAVHDNNWHLFVTFVNVVLDDLGAGGDLAIAEAHYGRMKQFYRGDGWFSDGPHERFDYYNAWGIHYLLSWLRAVRPGWDPTFLADAQRRFTEGYRHLVGPDGVPIFGRSLCYRLAVAAPLVFAAETDPDVVPPGEARRALDATWRYFIERGALRHGTVTQGYCAADGLFLDRYLGPASCLWSLRSLVAAFAQPDTAAFWRAAPTPLPVEVRDYRLVLGPTGLTVVGKASTHEIVVMREGGTEHPHVEPFTFVQRIATRLRGKPYQPENTAAKYEGRRYSSATPFCGCPD